jgi:hypothetical protein
VTSHEFDLATALVEVETPVWIGWVTQQKDKVKNQRILVVGSRCVATLKKKPGVIGKSKLEMQKKMELADLHSLERRHQSCVCSFRLEDGRVYPMRFDSPVR